MATIGLDKLFYAKIKEDENGIEGYYDIEYPSCEVFCYKDGKAVWHNVSLEMTAQEVV